MKSSVAILSLILFSVSPSLPQSLCSQRKSSGPVYYAKGGATYYVELCKIPNQEGKPALSIVFTSRPGGDNAVRIYSLEATKPLKMDGIYVERNGEKQFILHSEDIEWANGSLTKLESMDVTKRKRVIAVLEAGLELLKWAAEYQRVPDRNSQDKYNVYLVVNLMYNHNVSPTP